DVPAVAGVLYGIKPAVTAIVLFAAYRIGSRALKNAWLWAIAATAFIAIFVLRVPFAYIIMGAALIGIVGGRVVPDKFRAGGGHGAADKHFGAALIDDHHPAPEHARFNRAQLIKVGIVGLLLWAGVMAALTLYYGWSNTLTQMGWFFTKAALLTFGGAYAVLPYVYEGAVQTYQWTTATQMIDGLALGETTPGPLIMVVAFVGFVGGWTKEIFGPDSLFAAGAMAATVVTYFTFLPSFLFILLGAPFIESTRGELKFTAPLTAITAAVVGVILNLAVFFAYHVMWPEGMGARFDWISALIGIAAFIALYRFKVDVIRVIAASGAIGLVLTLL
ncbi:MAG TPA: chromate transporter, partial [Burkholderiales bacterium]|nr:chromate transporter [Burkholderiales bacterium]